jgi:hypothetical protein
VSGPSFLELTRALGHTHIAAVAARHKGLGCAGPPSLLSVQGLELQLTSWGAAGIIFGQNSQSLLRSKRRAHSLLHLRRPVSHGGPLREPPSCRLDTVARFAAAHLQPPPPPLVPVCVVSQTTLPSSSKRMSDLMLCSNTSDTFPRSPLRRHPQRRSPETESSQSRVEAVRSSLTFGAAATRTIFCHNARSFLIVGMCRSLRVWTCSECQC